MKLESYALRLAMTMALLDGCNSAALEKGTPSAPPDSPVMPLLDDAGESSGREPPKSESGTSVGQKEEPPGAYALPISHAVRLVVQPSDQGASLLEAIQKVSKSLHMTMYMLTSPQVIESLLERKRAGVDVKVILNQFFPDGGNANAGAYKRLKSAGVEVAWGPPAFAYVHSKSLILDNRQIWVMTMNATVSSPRDNREYLAIDDEPEDVAQAERIFEGDFRNLPSNADGALVVAPVNAFDRLIQLIDSARDSLLIQAEALAEDATVSAILRAQERGVRVQIVVADSLNTDGEQKALDRLGQSGVPLVVAKKPYMHAKAILVDGALAYVGSVNFTATSYSRNRELGLITDARDVVSLLSRTFASDFSGGRQP